MTFPVAHFENKRNFFAAFNGGKLIVADREYILKWCFFKVVRFPREETQIIPAPEGVLFRGFYFKCDKKVWEVWLYPKTGEKLYKLYLNDAL